uniref:Uncharacterized protein n=1 Tax=Coccidioides posadasii RMSCC 3488 TaxID=454284 RepID=A0A0J6FCV6_COCPO|nr:hypothetical protein CPAG_04460 [Coccidioides posadasii RMSCC 3488]
MISIYTGKKKAERQRGNGVIVQRHTYARMLIQAIQWVNRIVHIVSQESKQSAVENDAGDDPALPSLRSTMCGVTDVEFTTYRVSSSLPPRWMMRSPVAPMITSIPDHQPRNPPDWSWFTLDSRKSACRDVLGSRAE